MEHAFKLPVLYKGQEVELEGKWVSLGYVARFHVMLQEQEIVFEQDDERKYRAWHCQPDPNKVPIEKELLEAVVATLELLRP